MKMLRYGVGIGMLAVLLVSAVRLTAAGATRHLLYVSVPGIRNEVGWGGVGILVYDMDHGHRLVKRIPTLPVVAGQEAEAVSNPRRPAKDRARTMPWTIPKDIRDSTATRRARESLQLSIYALAYEAQHGQLPDKLALHFLESGIVGHSTPSPKRLAKAAEQVTTVSDGIRAGDFAPNPSPMRCGFCPFRGICPDAAR